MVVIDFSLGCGMLSTRTIKIDSVLKRFHYSYRYSDAPIPLNYFFVSGQRLRLSHLQLPYSVKGFQKCINPLVVTQYPVYYPSSSGNNLDRYPNQTVEK